MKNNKKFTRILSIILSLFIVAIIIAFDILPIQSEKMLFATLFLLIASVSIGMEEI